MVEEKTSKKKQLVLAGIGLVFLLVLVIGATYAYFQFASQNDFRDPATIEGSMGELGTGVILTKAEDSTLTLNLSAADMLVENAQTYYASGSEEPKTIATVHVDGAGYYNCTYTLEVTKTSTSPETDMYERFQSEEYTNKGEGQIWFTINDTKYDFYFANRFDENGKFTYSAKLETISSAEDINLTANMVIVNSETLDQTYLNGTDISLSINATEFNCTLINDKPVVTNLSTVGVGTDSITVSVEASDINGYDIESYTYSIDGGSEVTQAENSYTFENLDLNTEYEITSYVTNTEGYKSEQITQTFSTLSTNNLGNAIIILDGLGEVDNVSSVTVGDYTKATTVTDATYEMFVSTYSSEGASATSGTPIDNAFTYSNGTYTSVPENMYYGTYYHLKITIPSDGYYQVCYSLPSTSDGYGWDNIMFLLKDTILINNLSLISNSQSGCSDLGKIDANEYIKVVQYTHTNTTISPISFYIQRTEETKEMNPGYRYQGAEVNNYVIFNGETWRIIGSVDGNTIGLTSENNYTKIIRDEVFSNIQYDAADETYMFGNLNWPSSDLYNTLNGDYYNRVNDYAETGLTEESKGLIVSANWYHTNFLNGGPASVYYISERSDDAAVTNAYVGIMSPSDYGYAAPTEICGNIALNYEHFDSTTNLCHQKDWLYNGITQWLTSGFYGINPAHLFHFVYVVTNYGHLNVNIVANGAAVRPSVYLDTDIIITDGNGSSSSPYQIAKPTT